MKREGGHRILRARPFAYGGAQTAFRRRDLPFYAQGRLQTGMPSRKPSSIRTTATSSARWMSWIEASLQLIRRAGAEVAGLAVLMELGFLGGRARLEPALRGRPAGGAAHRLTRPGAACAATHHEADPEESGVRLVRFPGRRSSHRSEGDRRARIATMGCSGA